MLMRPAPDVMIHSSIKREPDERAPRWILADFDDTLAPGDTIRLGTYSVGERFAAPETELTAEVRRVLRNRKRPAAQGQLRTNEVVVSPEHRRYYLVVRSWK